MAFASRRLLRVGLAQANRQAFLFATSGSLSTAMSQPECSSLHLSMVPLPALPLSGPSPSPTVSALPSRGRRLPSPLAGIVLDVRGVLALPNGDLPSGQAYSGKGGTRLLRRRRLVRRLALDDGGGSHIVAGGRLSTQG